MISVPPPELHSVQAALMAESLTVSILKQRGSLSRPQSSPLVVRAPPSELYVRQSPEFSRLKCWTCSSSTSTPPYSNRNSAWPLLTASTNYTWPVSDIRPMMFWILPTSLTSIRHDPVLGFRHQEVINLRQTGRSRQVLFPLTIFLSLPILMVFLTTSIFS